MDRQILHRFFSGAASFEEEEAVCNWVEESKDNLEKLIKEREYFDTLIFHKVPNKLLQPSRFLSSRSFVAISFKAVAVIAVLFALSFSIYKVIQPAPLESMNKVIVPPGQRVELVLSDNTKVWLNACSEIVYPASFDSDTRQVLLQGEAYFEVTKDSKHPFIIKTEQCDVKVLGTTFNIQTDGYDNSFAVTLFEGAVELTDNKTENSPILLTPMQKAEWKNEKMTISQIEDLDIYRWREGLICFENTPFAELMNRFERIYGIPIIIKNENLGEFRCTGKFRISDGVSFVLQVLQKTTDFTFSQDDINGTIYIR